MIADYGPVILADSPGKGRGIFAARGLLQNELVDTSPLIVFSEDDAKKVMQTLLAHYVFSWPYTVDGAIDDDSGLCALVLGLGSLFNHDPMPNCRWEFDPVLRQQYVRTLRALPAGTELTVDYGYEPVAPGEPDPAIVALEALANSLREG